MKTKLQSGAAWALIFCGAVVSVNVVSVNSAHAADEALITDRPDFTESPQVVPRGMVQIEGGATYTREGAARQTELGELLVRVPVSRKAEVRIGVPSHLWQRDGARLSGFGDAFLGAKFALSDGEAARKKPALGLLIGTSLPTGRTGLGEDEFQPETVLAASWELCPTTSFNMNLGYARPSDGGARFNQVFGSVSVGHALNDKWGAYAELFGFNKADATGKSAKYANGGLTYLLNNDFQLDARLGFGLNNKVGGPDYFAGIGASRRF